MGGQGVGGVRGQGVGGVGWNWGRAGMWIG